MSASNLPKFVDKIDPYNSSVKRARRGSEGSTRFRAKAANELKPLPLLKGKLSSCTLLHTATGMSQIVHMLSININV